MDRLIAYSIPCRDCFKFLLLEEKFRIKGDGERRVIMPLREDVPLGVACDCNLVIYPESNEMSLYSISERTRLVRMCDEFKS